MKRLTLATLVAGLLLAGAVQVGAVREDASPIILSVGEAFFDDVRAVAAGTYKGQERFYVHHTDAIITYNSERETLAKLSASYLTSPADLVADDQGRLHIVYAGANQIVTVSPDGRASKAINVPEPLSVAGLSNGNIVVASPANGKRLHVYDASGNRLKSFGELRNFDSNDMAQNMFLNRGKVVVDSSDNIYFVFRYAPTPGVLKFSKKGKLISEFAVEGKAIDIQLQVARGYLRNRTQHEVGGIVIINSAAIDPQTGRLWVCMNGSSKSGVVYEYSPKGKKLHEYSFVLDIPSYPHTSLTGVTDVLVRSHSVYVLNYTGLHKISLDSDKRSSDFVSAQEVCGPSQNWPSCSVNCIAGSSPASQNCKAAIEAQIAQGLRIVSSTCDTYAPGTTTPPKPNGGCKATVVTCDTNTGETVTHTAELNCNPPPKYKCVNGRCVQDPTGTFNSCEEALCGSGGGCGEDLLETCSVQGLFPDYESCSCYYPSPIVIDVSGNGYDLTDADGGVRFDMNSDNVSDRISWTAAGSDDALLVLDRNGNGAVDNGAELFGNFTPQPASSNRNGFIALAEYDRVENGGNNDGLINAGDSIFLSLCLWQDVNHNGFSEPGELHLLPSLNVHAISLDYKESKRIDRYGNRFSFRAKVYDLRGAQVGRWAWDVFFTTR